MGNIAQAGVDPSLALVHNAQLAKDGAMTILAVIS